MACVCKVTHVHILVLIYYYTHGSVNGIIMIVVCISLCSAMCVCFLMQSVLHSCKSSFKLCASSVCIYIYIYSDATMVNGQLNGTTPSQTLCKEQQILTTESNTTLII